MVTPIRDARFVDLIPAVFIGGQHTDFREEAYGYQPRQFLIHGCPNCGYSGFGEDFSLTPIQKELSKLINDRLKSLIRDQRIPPWCKFEYAAQISIWMNKPPEETANLFLMAAYTCADDGASDEEAYNRTQAIEFFRKAIDKGTVPAKSLPEVTYLVGELYRRIHLTDEAAKWHERGETLAAAQSNLEWLVKLAKQQRTAPQEYIQQ